ncbi:MAG TPA: hypothetical protein VFP50_15485 [Anaeromyxobacteraceae bacterium]|nr:hypothetical protein [Anaeromyxobacteraceae bacterium]
MPRVAPKRLTANRLTPAELEAMEARERTATPGPWTGDTGKHPPYPQVVRAPVAVNAMTDVVATVTRYQGDQAFIAHARADVPALLAEVRASWAERDAARQQVDDMLSMIARSNESHATAAQLRAEGEARADESAAEVNRLRNTLRALQWVDGACPHCKSGIGAGTHARGCIIGVEVGLVRP